ncbi:hypothetical protein [Neobacillus muris]|uniref:hypothetical protein n=1 Tax=Neobacillus muris TaxID=2941334 RepID=UPI002040CAD3|nr:hypothetical protein [Neobacillus muris]
MKKSEWSDEELIQILRQMPKIEDNRHPHDVYQNIPRWKRKSVQWMFPGIAALAALLLFFILVPKFMDGNQQSVDKAAKSESAQSREMAEGNNTIKKEKSQDSTPDSPKMAAVQSNMERTAIYDDEIGNGQVLTFWIPDEQVSFLVPVSNIVAKSQGKTWMDLFTEKASELKEPEWGLTDYYPLNASMNLDQQNNRVLVDVPIGHQYGQGSANELGFMEILKKDVASNSTIKQIKLSTAGNDGIEFGNTGMTSELMVSNDKNRAFFFYYPQGSEKPFIVPFNKPFNDVQSALGAMKGDAPISGLQKSILPSFEIENVGNEGNTLQLSLKSNDQLEDNQQTLLCLEAILLTAKDFGFEKVAVSNSPITQIGPFDLTKEIQVPLAPNKRDF